jgi:hypothetical protein
MSQITPFNIKRRMTSALFPGSHAGMNLHAAWLNSLVETDAAVVICRVPPAWQEACRPGVEGMQQACSKSRTLDEFFTRPLSERANLRKYGLPPGRRVLGSSRLVQAGAAFKVKVLPTTVDLACFM